MSVRAPADVIEDLEFLDEQHVGATDAAQRAGFPTAHAMEKWLERHDAHDLWLSFKHRDPAGTHLSGSDRKRARLAQGERTVTDPIITLLDRADECGRAALSRKADRVRDLLAEIRTGIDLAEHEERAKREAREEVERLSRELAEAKARLRGAPTIDGPSAAAIREWAKANAVECPAMGRVPAAVREAYDQRDDAA